MKYFEKIKFFKNSMKEFKKEVKIKDSFIEDMDYFRGYVTFKEHNLVIIDKEKILTKAEILDFAIKFCTNKDFNLESFAKDKKVNITESTINETPTFLVQKIQTTDLQM
ncbi:MAG: hypothetical protein MSA34_02820 [Firmicutes bacterium]|nr:hypothetical protein [Bacillota bacterium]MDY5585905.1 hypothetical protein [Eubacteriales bacterium]